MLIYCYTIFFYLLTPFILLRLYYKSHRLPAYRLRINERFSWRQPKSCAVDIWLHAVSLGEVVAVSPLIEALLAKKMRILVTTMTPTGSQQVLSHFKDRVSHQYIPYDLPWCLRKFFKAINPRIGIIMETEIWPNLINQATKFKLPLLLINARISDNAFASYQTLDFFFKPILAKFNTICTQSEIDSQRFISLGAPVDKIHVLGNIKFDLNLVKTSNVNCTNLKMLWGEKRTVLMAASTHDDEEKQLLLNLPKLKRVIPDLILLIAPRHPERFQVVYELSQSSGFKTAKKTAIETINSNIEVLILDSIGELVHFYQLSDYAFVGGSLVPIGGHNVLEPIALKIPVFCGPFMQNSKTICDDLSKAGAISKVRDSDDLVNAIIFLHQNPVQKILQVTNATKVLEANRGSLARYLEIIASIINN